MTAFGWNRGATRGIVRALESEVSLVDVTGSWRVRFGADDVREMTLDQLDAAFQEGLVNEETMVLEHGATEWAKLGHVAGIDASEAEGRTATAADPQDAQADLAADLAPDSVAPTALEVYASDDEAPVEFRSRKRGVVVGLAAAALALFGAVVAVTSFSGTPGSVAAAGASSPVVDPHRLPQPVAESSAPAFTPRLTEAQTRALLEADKAREAKQQLNRPKAPPPRGPRPKSAPVFHEGGNDHDPLNAKL